MVAAFPRARTHGWHFFRDIMCCRLLSHPRTRALSFCWMCLCSIIPQLVLQLSGRRKKNIPTVQEKKNPRATVVSSANLFCVCLKTRGAKKRRKKGGGFFSITKHYSLISITAPLSNLLKGEGGKSLAEPRRVRLKPLLWLLINRRTGVKTHYFLHASLLPGSTSPGDLENVCSP